MPDIDSSYLWLVTFKALNDLGEKYDVALRIRARPLTDPPPFMYMVMTGQTVIEEFEYYKHALDCYLDVLESAIKKDTKREE